MVQTNKHRVFSSSSSSIFYRTITAVTKITTNFQNCIKGKFPYVTSICNSGRLPDKMRKPEPFVPVKFELKQS